MAPDDVVEDLADVVRLVERAEHGVDGAGPISCPPSTSSTSSSTTARASATFGVVALDRQLVAAQADRAVEPVAQRVEHAVADAGELGRDLVRNGEDSCTGSV